VSPQKVPFPLRSPGSPKNTLSLSPGKRGGVQKSRDPIPKTGLGEDEPPRTGVLCITRKQSVSTALGMNERKANARWCGGSVSKSRNRAEISGTDCQEKSGGTTKVSAIGRCPGRQADYSWGRLCGPATTKLPFCRLPSEGKNKGVQFSGHERASNPEYYPKKKRRVE